MSVRTFALTALLIGLSANTLLAADPADFLGMHYHADQSARQDDPLTTVIKSPTLSEGLKAVLAYAGVDPKVANVGVRLARTAVLSGGGNDVTQHYNAPAGYSLCSAWVGVHSITAGANIAFIFDAAGNIAIGAKTPAKDFGQGGQWVEADIKVLWVKTSKAATYRDEGICFSTPVASPNERYQCGETGKCKEYHLGHAFKVTGLPGNYIVKE